MRHGDAVTIGRVLADRPLLKVSLGEASHAWGALGGRAPAAVERLRAARRTKPALYRLTFAAPGEPAVYAKHGARDLLAVERRVHEEILPRVPLGLSRYRGAWEAGDGSIWLFVEDAGGRALPASDSALEVLAGRWLGRLHEAGAAVDAARRLPDASSARYLAHLKSGRTTIHRHFANPGLTRDDRAVLVGVMAQLDALEARWLGIERACEDLPATLVHGDFQTRNARLRDTVAGQELCVIDWEMAGWGVPAVDLGSACGPGHGIRIDPRAYQQVVCARWPQMRMETIERLSILGCVFRALAGIEWECSCLRFESRLELMKPILSLSRYSERITGALAAGGGWLG